MRVAFVGKGGSGKTTLSALFARYLARPGGRRSSPSTPTSTSTWPRRSAWRRRASPRAAGRAPRRDQGLPARRQPADPLGRRHGQDHPAGPGLAAAAPARRRPVHDRAVTRRAAASADGHRRRSTRTTSAWPATTPRSARSSCTQPPGRRPRRVRRGRHDGRRRLVRLRPVHPLRPDLPGRRADPRRASASTGSTATTPPTSTCRSPWSATRSPARTTCSSSEHVGDDLLTCIDHSAASAPRSRAARSPAATWSRTTRTRWTCSWTRVRRPDKDWATLRPPRRRVPPAQRPRLGQPGDRRGPRRQIDPDFVLRPDRRLTHAPLMTTRSHLRDRRPRPSEDPLREENPACR